MFATMENLSTKDFFIFMVVQATVEVLGTRVEVAEYNKITQSVNAFQEWFEKHILPKLEEICGGKEKITTHLGLASNTITASELAFKCWEALENLKK